MFTTKAKELTLNTITSDWAPLLESTSRKTGALLALLFTLGFVCGRLIHDWNDELTGFVVTLLGLRASAFFKGPKGEPEPEPQPEPARQTAEPVASPERNRVALILIALRQTPVVKLRKIAREHGMTAKAARVARKADLVAFLAPTEASANLTDLEISLGL